jgi:hypothetical protein
MGNSYAPPVSGANSPPSVWARCWTGPLTRRSVGLFFRVVFFFQVLLFSSFFSFLKILKILKFEYFYKLEHLLNLNIF